MDTSLAVQTLLDSQVRLQHEINGKNEQITSLQNEVIKDQNQIDNLQVAIDQLNGILQPQLVELADAKSQIETLTSEKADLESQLVKADPITISPTPIDMVEPTP